MKRFVLTVLMAFPFVGFSQYTEVINSNRPGRAVSAYALGSNVIQAEGGLSYEKRDHSLLKTDSNLFGVDLAIRYGLLFETLEIKYEGEFQNRNITYN